MKHFYNYVLLFLFVPGIALATNGKFTGKHTKEKKIHNESTVNANAGLEVDNSYGNIDIVTWTENRVVIDVLIKTNGNNEDKVAARLDEITVEFTANGSKVTAETLFGKKDGKWNSWWGKGNNNVSVEVNYIIKMPVTNTVDLDNNYGAISIDKLEGNARISCDYGQLLLGELMADNNLLNFDYTKNSTISYMKSGKINADYSGYRLDRAESLEVSADYTDSNIGSVTDLNYNNDYGKIKVDKAANVMGKGDYIDHTFGSVTRSLNIKTDYGATQVDRLEATCQTVNIKSEYARVNLGLANGANFDFIAKLNYANLKGKELLNLTKTHEENSDKMYEGYVGSKGSGNTINIMSNYGNITLTKN
ncbi:MAG: hypothetical protein R3359_00585 [Marinirhabdus sp.]|nr:hypothetical protein [Marinirhabdus sp.]